MIVTTMNTSTCSEISLNWAMTLSMTTNMMPIITLCQKQRLMVLFLAAGVFGFFDF